MGEYLKDLTASQHVLRDRKQIEILPIDIVRLSGQYSSLKVKSGKRATITHQ